MAVGGLSTPSSATRHSCHASGPPSDVVTLPGLNVSAAGLRCRLAAAGLIREVGRGCQRARTPLLLGRWGWACWKPAATRPARPLAANAVCLPVRSEQLSGSGQQAITQSHGKSSHQACQTACCQILFACLYIFPSAVRLWTACVYAFPQDKHLRLILFRVKPNWALGRLLARCQRRHSST